MPTRSFDDDAAQATATARPVPRGIAFQFAQNGDPPDSLDEVQAAVKTALPDWEIRAVEGLPGWFEALAPTVSEAVASRSLSMGEFWQAFRRLKDTPGVVQAEPLLLFSSPEPAAGTSAETFAAGTRGETLGLWGVPYDKKTRDAIRDASGFSDWHLRSMKIPEAWALWKERFPDPKRLPGDGIIVGHPDTGYSGHPEVKSVLKNHGRSFLDDALSSDEPGAIDDLRVVGGVLIEAPGHGTGTASVIASGGHDETGISPGEAFGVAPGAQVLPLRVSRSVIHFDFSNVARAILYAIDYATDQQVDVISMSLGGPGYSGFVREAIGKALEKGVIVVAAAGNYLPATAFPAAFPEVIGVAATNAAELPWRFSAMGRLVDIAAPGEDVWHALAELDGNKNPAYSVSQGSGTSYATACIAGVAALWLSYHGGRQAIANDSYGGDVSLVPFAFQYLLGKTAAWPDSTNEDKSNYGQGIVDAEALLRAQLPDHAVVKAFRDEVLDQRVNLATFFAGLLTGGRALNDPTPVVTTGNGREPARRSEREGPDGEGRPAEEYQEEAQLAAFFGKIDEELRQEIMPLIAADRVLAIGFHRWREEESRLPLLERLRGMRSLATTRTTAPAPDPGPALSETVSERLDRLRDRELEKLERLHKGALGPGAVPGQEMTGVAGTATSASEPPVPVYRQLRAYAFDPSLDTKLDTAPIYRVTIPVRWESQLQPGPVGEYLEVVDVDPASGCVYSPVDLNHPHILSQEGLPLSEGSPQFHQQMVYAVAMNTINRFELALGRPIFWSAIRPYAKVDYPEEEGFFTPEAIKLQEEARVDKGRAYYDALNARYVQRLRVYPHALREANAYYSPTKRALLFGYFPSSDESGEQYPGGTVFTCLSHDIIAHETTHAIVDGMHPYFNEPSNEDVWAFHEAFADIVALFQHFTYPEVLRHQIANSRGDLETDNLLGQLAQQFGPAIGQRGALRNYLGERDDKDVWRRAKPKPHALREAREPHERGSILVSAVFDAFLALYNDRIADLMRIATGGTGVLPAGKIHPDLANRLAAEAAQTADEVLQICIRAMDYVPPVDITFGEFLRALITADYDLSSGVRRKNRIAFIEAFRSWGIYPRDVTTLSEDSLLWRSSDPDSEFAAKLRKARENDSGTASRLAAALESWQPGMRRDQVFQNILAMQRELHSVFRNLQGGRSTDRRPEPMTGLDWRDGASFAIHNLRPARRLGPHGEFRTEVVFEIVQTDRSGNLARDGRPLRGGATLILDLASWRPLYVIHKSLYRTSPSIAGAEASVDNQIQDADRGVLVNRLQQRITGDGRREWLGEGVDDPLRQLIATYDNPQSRSVASRTEPFAVLHRRA